MKNSVNENLDWHLEQLGKVLENYGVAIEKFKLIFYDASKITKAEAVEKLAANDLMDLMRARVFFKYLCRQGKAWINLIPKGVWKKYYLVAIECAEGIERHSETYVQLIEPTPNTSVLWKGQTSVNIIGSNVKW